MSFDWSFFNKVGWTVFERDEALSSWVCQAKKNVRRAMDLKDLKNNQFRSNGTWFVGANFLKNDVAGKLDNVALDGEAFKAITERYGRIFNYWDEAQVSICYEGYPKMSQIDTEASFNYKKNRFGAHVDGILPVGKAKRRYAKEYHSFIFGIPLVSYNEFAAPLVVWEGSHHIIRTYLAKKLLKIPINLWKDEDITEVYHEARREAFFQCKIKIIVAPVGASYILHRLSLHGIMPWEKTGCSEDGRRMIAYFRPILNDGYFWLDKTV